MKGRHEYKHSLNYVDYTLLRNRLQAVIPHDANVNADGEYSIRSLYFDTPTDKVLREKIDGINFREKFRIRRYNDDTNFMRLEKKSKINTLCNKHSDPITSEEVKRLLAGDLQWMMQDGRPLVLELYSRMRNELLAPKVLVDYIREPFAYGPGNVRITFDRDIRTGLHCTDFLNNAVPTIAAGEEIVLLEVKYDEFLPGFIADLLQIGYRSASACSKYALCRIYG